jgi:hypothetical protein
LKIWDYRGNVCESSLCPSNLKAGSRATFEPVLKDLQSILETFDRSARNFHIGIQRSQLEVSLSNFRENQETNVAPGILAAKIHSTLSFIQFADTPE